MSNAGQFLSAAVGGAIGFVIGGPAGAVYGLQVGLLAGSLIFPTEISVEGPRLEDVERLAADPGEPIPIVWGTAAVAGFRLYLCDTLTEVSSTEEVGGKGPEQEVTTYEYFQTLALGLCRGPIAGVGRIWENGELVYDPRGQLEGESDEDYQARLEMSAAYAETFTLYLGDEEQEADPTLESELGEGNVPAFRGLAYMVFPDRALKSEQAYRHPAFKVEITRSSVARGIVAFTAPNYNDYPNPEYAHKFEVPEGVSTADVLIVGGGGGGAGGGGGSGGWKLLEDYSLTPGQSIDVWVGQGGAAGGDGSPSLFDGIQADGGGGGGSAGAVGRDGASGGGGHGTTGGSAVSGQGNPGGAGGVSSASAGITFRWCGGGGGGAGTAGGPAQASGNGDGGAGGVGKYFGDIFGDEFGQDGWFCGGGGGAEATLPAEAVGGPGGMGGGLAASNDNTPQPWANTGGGGGGYGSGGGSTKRQVGRSGVVLVRYSGSTLEEGRVSLSAIVSDVCLEAGLSEAEIDVTDLVGVSVRGYAVSRISSGRSILEPVRMAGFFDYVESDGKIIFRRRGGPIVDVLDAGELGVYEIGTPPPPPITTTKLQDAELPRQIRVRYFSYGRDYERGEQLSPVRIGTVGVNDVSVEIPMVIDDSRAAQIAEVMFREAWASRYAHEFSLGPEHHALEPGDPIIVQMDGRAYRVRIASIDDAGLIVRKVRAVRDDDGSYVSVAIASDPVRPPSHVTLVGETELELLDLPALRDQDDDPGLYAAAWRSGTGQTWNGAKIYRSVDGGSTWSDIATVANQATVGTLVSAPSSGDGYTWDDEQYIDVDIITDNATLSSRTDDAVLSGANVLAIGAHGRWHLVQFANSELISEGRYRLTRLLLGRRGTEHLIGTEQVGDRVVLLSGPGIIRVPLQTAQIGTEIVYRAVTSGAAFSSASDENFTGAGQALETFSPVHASIERDESGNITATWTRRDRLSQTLRSGVAIPNSEDSEAYEVDVLDSGSVVRTINGLSTTEAEYSAADQTSDFGSPQSTVTLRIYQLSATVGRGQYLEVTG